MPWNDLRSAHRLADRILTAFRTSANRRSSAYLGAIISIAILFVGAPLAKAADSPVASNFSSAAAGTWLRLAGELEVSVADYDGSSETSYFLKMGEVRIPLRFVKDPPTNLLSGARVRVRGRKQRDGSLRLASLANVKNGGTSTTSPSPGPLPNTFGAQSTLVILVNFQDNPTNQPYTTANAQSVVFGTANDFFYENSYKQTWLTGNVVGWYTIPVSSASCDISSIASYAQSAASAAGVNLSAYTRYVYAFPWNASCGFAGASNVGGSPSQSWINGTDGSGSLDLHVVDHELGHAFGLLHSHLLDCGTSATIGSDCTINEYGDIIDTMGAYQPRSPHYNGFQKERLGWLNYGTSPSITTVKSSGTYVINSYELSGSGPNALKILKSTDPTTGAKTWYYLEARQAIGFDAFLTDGTCEPCWDQTVTDGVLVHIGTDGDGGSSDLLDMTPATQTYAWYFDPSLVVGQSFQDPSAGVTLTTDSVTSTQTTVTVQFTGALSVATGQPSYSPGQTVSITTTANFGGSPVANVQVNITIAEANGSVVTGSVKTGNNGTAVYNLKLKSTAPSGTYQVGVSATIGGTSTTAAISFTVS